MAIRDGFSFPLIIYSLLLVISLLLLNGQRIYSEKVLRAGKELFQETLPLKMGSCLYKFEELKPHTWYEVKISYPASIPAIVSLQLKTGNSDVEIGRLRKLLNTEKLIFKSESSDVMKDQGGTYVLVSVEPEGIVAIPGVQERETIIYNIVCDELFLGLPHKAWPVIVFAIICLVLGFVAPRFLPPYLLTRKGETQRKSYPKHR